MDGDWSNTDYIKAYKYFEKAAYHGHQQAQYFFGLAYEKGIGVEKNISKAYEWYKKSADQGNEYAQYSLYAL